MPDLLAALAAPVAARLMARRETVAVSESSAGGLISACLLSIPGASAYFLGGGVIYTQAARRTLLAVPDDAVRGIRSSTEAYALLKARTVRERLGTTWGLAETGAAGPTGNRYGDAAGHSCIAVAGPIERARTIETGRPDREANMWAFTRAALELLEGCVKEHEIAWRGAAEGEPSDPNRDSAKRAEASASGSVASATEPGRAAGEPSGYRGRASV